MWEVFFVFYNPYYLIEQDPHLLLNNIFIAIKSSQNIAFILGLKIIKAMSGFFRYSSISKGNIIITIQPLSVIPYMTLGPLYSV